MNDNLGKKAEKKIKEWRPVVGWESRYEVSNFGEVRSIDRYVPSKNGSKQFRPGRNLKIHIFTGSKYRYVVLSKPGYTKNALVHRLVAEAFIPNPNNLPQVNHKDGDKNNNTVENLEWCTASYNIRHAYDNGLMIYSSDEHMKHMSELGRNKVCKSIICIETNEQYSSMKACAEDMGIRVDYIYEYFSGSAKSCFGYHFKYA